MKNSTIKIKNPKFELFSTDDKFIDISDYYGKKIILFIWASWWGCREQLPVWQEFYDKYNKYVRILSIAIDFQGKSKVIPYIEKLDLKFPTLIDEKNITGQLYNFKAVPNGIMIDEYGNIAYKKIGGFDIRDKEIKVELINWFTKSYSIEPIQNKMIDIKEEAVNLFEKGMTHYESNNIKLAIKYWKKSVEIDPDNYIIRKQIWAIENPEKFYSGKIDYNWQKNNIKQNK